MICRPTVTRPSSCIAVSSRGSRRASAEQKAKARAAWAGSGEAANETVGNFIRGKIRQIVKDPKTAEAQKVVHKVVPADQLLAEAKRWIKESPNAVQPWDRKGFEVPGGLPNDKGTSTVFTMGNALYRKQSYNNYPAQRYILSCVYEGLSVPIDAGLRIEARYFTKLLMDPASRNMIRFELPSVPMLAMGHRPFVVLFLGFLLRRTRSLGLPRLASGRERGLRTGVKSTAARRGYICRCG